MLEDGIAISEKSFRKIYEVENHNKAYVKETGTAGVKALCCNIGGLLYLNPAWCEKECHCNAISTIGRH